MGNKYYDPGVERAARVNDLFRTVAPRYDLINDLQSFGMHRLWKRRLLAAARPETGAKALDLCCGTGDVALALAARGLEVVGLDFSEAMLRVARRRAGQVTGRERKGGGGNRAQKSRVDFVRGDALRIPYRDGTFDIVTISYGLRNLADWRRGLEEMGRVAKPGGRLLVLDFGKPRNVLWRQVYFGYLRGVVPLFGKMCCGDSETHGYIYESLRHYPAQVGVAEQMREMGCEKVRVINLLGGIMSINYGERLNNADEDFGKEG